MATLIRTVFMLSITDWLLKAKHLFENLLQLHYTRAHDCSNSWSTSTADLSQTDFAFLSSVAATYKPSGWRPYGEGTLSSNNQRLTVRNRGLCGSTYTNLPDHLVPIEFINTR